jgi:hypothetical protein
MSARERLARVLAALLALLAVLVLDSSAAAQLNDSDLALTADLDVRIYQGFPVTRHSYHGPMVFGLQLRNRGGERSVRVDVSHPTALSRTLRVPAGERVRAFFALPARAAYGMAAVFDLTDSRSGKRRRLTANSEFQSDEPLARLGAITTAFNVDKPFVFIGALDGRMPDDARALSGVRVIVVEHAYAVAHADEIDWKPVLEWVAMGGVLLVSTPASDWQAPPPWGERLPFARIVRVTEAGLVQEVGYGAIARVFPERLATVSGSFLGDLGVCESCRWSVDEREVDENIPLKYAHDRLRTMVARPGWGLFGVLLLFATAVGPVGWSWLIRRRGLPLHYLGFVVATAALFSIAVLGHDLIENGIDAKCAARSLVLLDQRTGVELGVEDAALYAPTSRGTRLRVKPGALLLLPSSTAGTDIKPELELAQGFEWLANAVPVRQRELVATRWLSAQRGGLELEQRADGLWIENQTGRELASLVLWRDGASYRVSKLARGARERGEPCDAKQAEVSSINPPYNTVVGHGDPLAEAIVAGELGGNRWIASYAWSPESSALVGPGVAPRPGREHVIAGVF